MRTRMTVRLAFTAASASSEVKTISAEAAPGEAGKPEAITSREADGSSVGCSIWSSEGGINAQDRFLAGDRAFLSQFNGDAQRGLGRALAGARVCRSRVCRARP